MLAADGEQVRPADARRWILIRREKGIAVAAGGGAVWSVDHLVVDQDAVPTLVEVKRGTNPEVRRTIIGQMLEYAAPGYAGRAQLLDRSQSTGTMSPLARGR